MLAGDDALCTRANAMSMDNMQRDQRIAHHVGHRIGCTQVGAGEQTIGHAALLLRPKPPRTTVANLGDRVKESAKPLSEPDTDNSRPEVVRSWLYYYITERPARSGREAHF